MAEHSRLGDFVLGLQGLAIIRNHWMARPRSHQGLRRSSVIGNDRQASDEEEPWSEPWHAEEPDGVERGLCRMGRHRIRRSRQSHGDWPRSQLSARSSQAIRPAARSTRRCGTGQTRCAYLASLGHEVIGIDCTPEMLEVAKAKAPTARFETGDLTALPLPSDAVDLAVCTLALTHFTHLGAANGGNRTRRPAWRPRRPLRRSSVHGDARFAGRGHGG